MLLNNIVSGLITVFLIVMTPILISVLIGYAVGDTSGDSWWSATIVLGGWILGTVFAVTWRIKYRDGERSK